MLSSARRLTWRCHGPAWTSPANRSCQGAVLGSIGVFFIPLLITDGDGYDPTLQPFHSFQPPILDMGTLQAPSSRLCCFGLLAMA